jgi:hypothetical protein
MRGRSVNGFHEKGAGTKSLPHASTPTAAPLGVDGLIDGALDEVVVGLHRVGAEVVSLGRELCFALMLS